MEHPSINKREWTEEEIERLKEIAAKHNYLDWQTIAQELGVRSELATWFILSSLSLLSGLKNNVNTNSLLINAI